MSKNVVDEHTFLFKYHHAIHIQQLKNGSLVVRGATIGPMSNNALRLVPEPKPTNDQKAEFNKTMGKWVEESSKSDPR